MSEPEASAELTASQLDERVAELGSRISSEEGFLASTQKAYKKFRQMRGIDAVRRAEHFGNQMKSMEEKLSSLRAQLGEAKAELDRRGQA